MRIALTAALVVATLGRAAAADPLAVDLASRLLAPGELVVLTVAADRAPSSVHVRVFGRNIPAFELPDGRWRALIGIDLDQRPGQYTAAVEAQIGGSSVQASRAVIVRPKRFPTRALRVDPDYVNPNPAQMTRLTEEAAFLRQLYLNPSPQRLWDGAFVRPVPGQANSRFGSRSVFNGQARSPHGGADLLSPAGTPIHAPNAGRIVCARDLFFTGNTVVIDHGLGLFSLLAHLSRIDVHEGQTVVAGEVLGLVGATGRVTGPHLHWGLTVGGARVDPLSLLALLGDAGTVKD